jgi:hypothetical protein
MRGHSLAANVTLKIEAHGRGNVKVLRLIGRIRGEHVHELERLMKGSAKEISLDLAEVTIVDAEVIKFLAACAARGIPLLNCLTYITDWISKEGDAQVSARNTLRRL